jgi:hypothetical protein
MLRHLRYFSFVVIMLSALCTLNAQEFRSTLTGRVIDQTGAVVVDVPVRAIEMNTNSRYETVSNKEGLYTFPVLLPGTYELTAEAKGFQSYSRKGIQINANARVAVDIALQVGEGTDSVTVTADAPPLESVRASAGQSITSHELENLPLDGHTALDAEFLGFGVISQANRSSNSPSGNAGFATISMGGAAQGANEILLDGVPDIGTAGTTGRRPALLPPPDSVSEVKTEAFAMDAASGGAGGGTSEMVTKGGTNELHGALSEYNNNPKLQATEFFVNATGATKSQSRTNQWSAVVGGPVLIPKVLNGRNRLFFFFAYEGIHSNAPTAAYATTPTAKERTGDFSDLLALNTSKKNYTLYDPNTAVLSGSTVTRQAFPNNVIPQSRLNPVAQKFVNTYMPLPNRPGTYDDTNNYGGTTVTKNPYHFFSGRGDVNISDRNKLSLVGRESMFEQDNDNVFSNPAYINNILYRASWGGMADDVHVFSPSMFADWRLGYTRYDPYYGQASAGYDPTQLGFPSYVAANSTHLMMPQFSMTDYSGNASGGNYTDQPLSTYQFFNSYTKIQGQHTLKFGGELRLQDYINRSWSGSTGLYTFDSGTWIKQTSTGSAPTQGGSLAQFLLGLPTSGTFNITSPYKVDSYYGVLFVQDDWHARPNLTLNIGLRWEHVTPSVESYNRAIAGFDATAVNKVTTAAETAYANKPSALLPASAFNANGGVRYATSSNRAPYDTPDKSFAPRFGVSWVPKALKGKTVIRSGVGIFYYNYGAIGANQPGYSQSTSYVPTNDNYVTPATTLNNPFPSGILAPVGSSLGVDTYLGQSVTFNNPQLQNQYGIRWNFDVQYQLSTNTTLEAAYIGNHAIHLTTSYDANALPLNYLSTSLVRDQATINTLATLVSNPLAGLLPGTNLNSSTTAVSNLMKPYAEFSGLTESNMNNGSSNFNQLAVKLSKRLSSGLLFFVNYSHSRMMARAAYLNAGDQPAYQVAADDRPDYFVFAGVYDMPFGRGRHFLSNTNRVAMFLLGNWQVAGQYSRFQGAPLSFGNLIYYGGDLNYKAHNASGPTFDTSVFNLSSSQQLSNNYRVFPSLFNNLRLDGMNNINLNVSKSFVIHEDIKLQVRGESYNVANRPLFGSPNVSTATASDFGLVSKTTNAPRAVQLALRLTF